MTPKHTLATSIEDRPGSYPTESLTLLNLYHVWIRATLPPLALRPAANGFGHMKRHNPPPSRDRWQDAHDLLLQINQGVGPGFRSGQPCFDIPWRCSCLSVDMGKTRPTLRRRATTMAVVRILPGFLRCRQGFALQEAALQAKLTPCTPEEKRPEADASTSPLPTATRTAMRNARLRVVGAVVCHEPAGIRGRAAGQPTHAPVVAG